MATTKPDLTPQTTSVAAFVEDFPKHPTAVLAVELAAMLDGCRDDPRAYTGLARELRHVLRALDALAASSSTSGILALVEELGRPRMTEP
jgi:hypothetical protein